MVKFGAGIGLVMTMMLRRAVMAVWFGMIGAINDCQ
jgi:hypothetical protein